MSNMELKTSKFITIINLLGIDVCINIEDKKIKSSSYKYDDGLYNNFSIKKENKDDKYIGIIVSSNITFNNGTTGRKTTEIPNFPAIFVPNDNIQLPKIEDAFWLIDPIAFKLLNNSRDDILTYDVKDSTYITVSGKIVLEIKCLLCNNEQITKDISINTAEYIDDANESDIWTNI